MNDQRSSSPQTPDEARNEIRDEPGRDRPSGAGSSAAAKPSADEPASNVKETIESILVAFILAFIFRAFVVEAFVIPTGSMAPTLMGAHMHFTCPDCGYQWDVGYDLGDTEEEVAVPNFAWEPSRGKGGPPVAKRVTAYCPNCGCEVSGGYQSPIPLHYGDRILVLKYLYLLNPARRWDVVVFKAPYIPQKAQMDPSGAYDYSVNYIKRLTGLPGESIMILDGELYASRGEDNKPDSQKTWIVQTKPRYAQQAMWRLVYNNDFHPLNSPTRSEPWHQPWAPRDGSGWDTGGDTSAGCTFSFSNAERSGRLEFDRNANSATNALTDWSGYNLLRSPKPHPVSDLKLDLWYQRLSGAGAARFELTKLDHTFIAEFTPDHARLLHRLPNGKELELCSAALDDGAGNRAMHIEFQNVDYQVTLRVNDKDLFVTTAQQYAPDMARLIAISRDERNLKVTEFPYPKIAIEAEKQECRLQHIALYRDTYYTYSDNPVTQAWGGPYDLQTGQGGPVHLGPDEYFVCGDNSPESLDARFWTQPIQPELLHNEDLAANSGRVPGRFLLGKAFFVYWPAGFRPFGDNSWAMIPDFGHMRFIH